MPMLTVYPDYYPRFRCIADRCRHTCCAGWEIDIDEESLKRFRETEGIMGQRLRASISEGDEPHFILEEGERCPFLNGRNLCDLILYGGEGFLCQICTDHPRFRSFLPGRTEIGLGLCCEAAGALILGRKEPMILVLEGTPEPADEEEEYVLALRDRLFALAQDRSIPVRARMENILKLCGGDAAVPDGEKWLELCMGLERLEESWTAVLEEMKRLMPTVDMSAFEEYMRFRETEFEQLLVYFLYRHVPVAYEDGDAAGKAAFAVLSVMFLMQLGAVHYSVHGEFTFEDMVEYARRYSGEVEYSRENLDALFDALAAKLN